MRQQRPRRRTPVSRWGNVSNHPPREEFYAQALDELTSGQMFLLTTTYYHFYYYYYYY